MTDVMMNKLRIAQDESPEEDDEEDQYGIDEAEEVEEEEDEDEDDEEDECVDEDDDEDDCDENEDEDVSDDYCSDESSTTSTSSTNAQPEATRVCDCCYCEVFGHGITPAANTSQKYAEMRERLRMRLSKRRAEKYEKGDQVKSAGDHNSVDDGGGGADRGCSGIGSHHSHNNVSTNASSTTKQAVGVVDQRNLDELLNYIMGSGNKASSNKRKDRERAKNSKSNNKKQNNNKSSNNNHSSSNNKESSASATVMNNNMKQPQHNNKHNQSHITLRNHFDGNHPKHNQQSNKSKQHQQRKMKEHKSTPEDIFKPRNDIDLDNGELDEFERELEQFKRFCYDSVPLKERPRLELKAATTIVRELKRYSKKRF